MKICQVRCARFQIEFCLSCAQVNKLKKKRSLCGQDLSIYFQLYSHAKTKLLNLNDLIKSARLVDATHKWLSLFNKCRYLSILR